MLCLVEGMKSLFIGIRNKTFMKEEEQGVEALKRQNTNKTRTTVYFPELEYRMLNEIYTRRLLSNQKTDKSTLICEAIHLLYEKDEEM